MNNKAIEIVGEEEEIDFNRMMMEGSSDSMPIHVTGEPMCPEIRSGDWVVLAFDIQPRPGDIVIAKVAGGYTIKRLSHSDIKGRRGLYLVPTNGSTRQPSAVETDSEILGVVISMARSFRQAA